MTFFTQIENTKNVNLAKEVAHHDFTVSKHSLQTDNGISIPDHISILKDGTNEYLGTVGHGWEPVQPESLYDLAEELIASTNASINGVFTMNKGSVIGIQFNLAERQYVPEDIIRLNFVMVTAFNGTHGISGHSTTYRTISNTQCNTSNKVYNMKHTKNVHNRIEVAKNILRYYDNEIASFDKHMITLVKNRMNDNAAVDWFKSLFPKTNSERAENILNNQVGTFIDCLHNGAGSNIAGVRGTCYGAFQALTEYINHYRSTRVHNDREAEEVKFQSIHFGSGNTLAQKGLANITNNYIEFTENDFMIN